MKNPNTLTELVRVMAEAIADCPEDVEVLAVEGESSVVIEVDCAPEDRKHLIGRNGNMAYAMRTVFGCAARKQQKKAMLHILSGDGLGDL